MRRSKICCREDEGWESCGEARSAAGEMRGESHAEKQDLLPGRWGVRVMRRSKICCRGDEGWESCGEARSAAGKMRGESRAKKQDLLPKRWEMRVVRRSKICCREDEGWESCEEANALAYSLRISIWPYNFYCSWIVERQLLLNLWRLSCTCR